jgi:predicted DNA-binding transcriptional regulator AlpA
MRSDAPVLLNFAEAAARAGISTSRLTQLRREGRFPAPALCGPPRIDGQATSVRWSSTDVDAWRGSREVPASLNSFFAERSGAHLRGPSFTRAAEAEAAARNLAAYGARVDIDGPRSFVLWIPARDEDRNARTLNFLSRNFPGLAFELMDGFLL